MPARTAEYISPILGGGGGNRRHNLESGSNALVMGISPRTVKILKMELLKKFSAANFANRLENTVTCRASVGAAIHQEPENAIVNGMYLVSA